jgi:general nucleoside transport system ATP-binding protein
VRGAWPHLQAEGLSKRFGAVVALNGASIMLEAGGVMAIVGENGAGKSTLAKILAGVYAPDSGSLRIDGRAEPFLGRRRMAALGVGYVPQSLSFVGTLSGVENHLLAASPFVLDRAGALAALRETGARLGIEAPWRTPVERLSLAERQLVEIVSAIAHGARILLLDEPTSALGPVEVDRLIEALAMLARAGVAVGLVTHRVREVLEGAQQVSVLRSGQVVFVGPVQGLDGEAIARLMVGDQSRAPPAASRVSGPARLVVERLHVGRALTDVSFSVGRGEIVGVAGVAGAAQPALAEAVAGLRPEAQGRVLIDGVDVSRAPAEARRRGLAYIPENRDDGAPHDLTMAAAASLLRLGERAFTRFGMRWTTTEAEYGGRVAERFDVRPPDPTLSVGALSGGNRQKLVVGREIERGPNVIIAHGPAQGLDLGAASAVRRDIADAAAEGAAVLIISTDLDELIALSSRILVLAGGRIAAQLDCAEANIDAGAFAHRIGEAMTGARAEALPA